MKPEFLARLKFEFLHGLLRYIQATWSAFAAVRRDGVVLTWGEAAAGGDSNEVREQLRDVQQIQVGQQKPMGRCLFDKTY